MSKKKAKKGGLPKRIGGMKIPKSVRNGQLGALLGSPAGQEIIAGSLLAVTGALAGKKAVDGDGKHLTRKLKHAGGDAAGAASAATSTLAFALGEAARSFIDALQHGPQAQAWSPEVAEASPPKKKPSSTGPSPGL